MALGSLLPAIHPGEILREEYLSPLNMTSYVLAKKLGVPRTRIERIIAEKNGITPDTALRLAKFFQTSPQFWMNMQASYDLKIGAEALKDQLAAIPELKIDAAA
ncbi:HigA family addiction module antidote protein [Rhizobium sp. XQZ8]|uniref:HigA family addiction module antitoxin n=1 Tax=Rhizobium populisoli TaxID=2859785 RepID=UPI001CA4CF08|nr:HigA family addiction module antitoxin [Rhizobium populisoli]MBW6421679.1 HigA family addiction module antidote protein [Rhizobium populisoli]